ncbi:MAG: hypothetical protein IPL95_16675 [Saprospiraceae bacterium]|nr:hypothetical protein [Saprospiraceae bacterium]
MYKSLLGYPHKTNIFYDSISLQTHTEEIYYRISAVDFRSNYSEYSDVLELKKPDKVPPSPPTFYDFKFRKNKIQLAWYPSDAKDVVAYLLYKKMG